MNFTKPVTDWAADFDYLGARLTPLPDRGCSQGIVTVCSMDHTVCDAEETAMKNAENDTWDEPEFDNPLLPFCLDDLTRNERGTLEHDLILAARIQQTLLPSPEFAPSVRSN